MRIRVDRAGWLCWLCLPLASMAPLMAEGGARLAEAARMQNAQELRALLRIREVRHDELNRSLGIERRSGRQPRGRHVDRLPSAQAAPGAHAAR